MPKKKSSKPKTKKRSEIENACPYKFVEVHAFDWTTDDSQMSIKSAPERMTISDGWISGYLIHEDDKRIIIAQQIFDSNSCRACITISKATIMDRIDYD